MKVDSLLRVRERAMRGKSLMSVLIATVALAACDVANRPYPADDISGNVFYTSFQELPKYLDPASTYALNETPWTYSIYEPLLGYHYLKRPYTLEGRTAEDVPTPQYLDKDGKPLPDDAPAADVATSVYTFKLKPNPRYQPHPALAKAASGKFLYHDLAPTDIRGKYSIADFPLDKAAGVVSATREATAHDYVYQIKRLASPYVPTPVPLYNILNQYEYTKSLLAVVPRIAGSNLG